MPTREAELELLEDINDGIYEAVFRAVESDAIDGRDTELDPIRMNKLQYLLDRELDLGLTFGWFKYGPAPNDPQSGSTLTRDPEPHSGPRPTDLGTSSLGPDYPSPDEIADVLTTELNTEFSEAVTADETKEYIASFYRTAGPEDPLATPFVDLYVASANLQLTLDRIGENSQWHADGTDLYYELDDRLQRLLVELDTVETVAETVPVFEQYRSLIKSVVAEATDAQPLMPDQQDFLQELVGIFYVDVWDYAAQLISTETMRGENTDRLEQDVERKITSYRDRDWSEFFDDFEERRYLYRLGNESPWYSDAESDQDTTSTDDDLLESVTRLGTEVLHGDGS
jgi:hypothetical protein